MLIPGYPKGSDLTILDTSYIGRRQDENGKFKKDYISLLFKDNVTGEKHVHIIYEPEYTYYKLKEGYRLDHHLFFIDKDKVEPITTKYSQLLKDIADKTGNKEFFYDNIRSRNSGENRRLHTLNEVFMSDINVEDYYRMLFAREYKNDPIVLNKGYFDIEVDGRYTANDFPDLGEVPVNSIAFIDQRTKTVFQFLLEDDRNPLIDEYKNHLRESDSIDKLKKFIIQAVGGRKAAKRLKVDELDYKFMFFKNEMELIETFFKVIHQLSPDIMVGWNSSDFDINYLIERIRVLGTNPEDIICDPRIKEKYLRLYVDIRNKNSQAERGDFLKIATFTVWLDQMIQFASRRKGRSQFESFSLDYIGQAVAKVKKLDYSHITTQIAMLPYLNYMIFSRYNIMDVIVQMCIETKTNDLDYIFAKCIMNNTRYAKGHRQSVYLANRFAKDFYEYGYIIGNNNNKGNEKPEEKYPGAQVGDPLHNSTYAVMYINGQPTLLAANVVDYDYKALYPNITLENNMAPNTQIGRYELNEKVSYNEHEDMYTSDEDSVAKYSRAGEFLENMMSGCHLEFCKRWLHLGDFIDVVHDMQEYYSNLAPEQQPEIPMNWNPNDAIYFSNPMVEVLRFQENEYAPGMVPALFFYEKLPTPAEELISDITKGAFVK